MYKRRQCKYGYFKRTSFQFQFITEKGFVSAVVKLTLVVARLTLVVAKLTLVVA